MEVETSSFATLLAFLMGVGLAAACGYRVFVPLLVASLAINVGIIPPEQLDPSLQWMGSDTAIIIFATATLFEVLAYYFPIVDNLLDTLSTPTAAIAGTLITFAFTPEMSPMLKWGLAALAGGATAGILQSGTAVARGGSTVITAGIANPVFSTIELVIAFVISLLAIFVPILCALIILFLLIFTLRLLWQIFCRRKKPTAGAA